MAISATAAYRAECDVLAQEAADYGLARVALRLRALGTAIERDPALNAPAANAARPAGDLTGTDRGSLAWIEWWMSHHERDGGLGGTLTAALAGLRDLMERFDIPVIPMDRAQPAAQPAAAPAYPPRPMTVQEAVAAGIIEDGSWGYGDRCPNCSHHDVFPVSDDEARCVWCGFVVEATARAAADPAGDR